MTRADNSHHLRRAAAARNLAAHDRTRAVIEDLDRSGQPITFVAVARAAGVSRSWLYNQTDLNDTIVALRRAGAPPDIATPPFAQRARPTLSANVSTQPARTSRGSAPTTPRYETNWPAPSDGREFPAKH
jgi:hypothetical protein